MTLDESAQIENGQYVDPLGFPLKKHTSNLPDWLYILSFAPPCPHLFRSPKRFFAHPHVLYALGTIFSLLSGAGLPAFDILFGYWTNGIGLGPGESDESGSSIIANASRSAWMTTAVSVIFIPSYACFRICFSLAGVQLANSVREHYLAAVLVQDQAFFDRVGAGEIIARSSRDIDTIRTGLGERLGYLFWSASLIIAGLASAFAHAPRLGGVLFSLIVSSMAIFYFLGIYSDRAAQTRSPLDGKASTFVEQVISSVRIVQSFDMSDRLLHRLDHGMLKPLKTMAKTKAGFKALEQAVAFGFAMLVYSMCFWYGGISVEHGVSVGAVVTAFYNYVDSFFGFAGVVPHLVATTTAIQNIANLRLQIERDPPIDVRNVDGLRLGATSGWRPSFDLTDVTFAYPARPSHKALDHCSVTIEPGKFIAFVGPSGSGKSTLVSLLLRFYDPQTATIVSDLDRQILKAIEEGGGEKMENEGDSPSSRDEVVEGDGVVRFADHDVRDYNLKWLRSQVAVVPQNPQLVSGTVFDNVAIGLTGTEWEYRADIDGLSATASKQTAERLERIQQMVHDALRKSHAWDFVQQLPDGLSTHVAGGRTGVLSGGQVQRIALARALVRQPSCLLLDEATSAVSADAELQIQETLLREQRERGMTLIVIAHRLSTIVSADKIVVMVAGRAVHSGTYDELLDPACIDQTFRSMALAAPQDGVDSDKPIQIDEKPSPTMPTAQSSQTMLDDSTTQPPELAPPSIIHAHDLTKLDHSATGPPELVPPLMSEEHDRLPPSMRNTSEAFGNVEIILSFAVVLGLIAGGAFIVASWLHGRAIVSLSMPDIPTMLATVNRWALWFLVLAIGTFFVIVVHTYLLEFSGESIVCDLRRETVRALIKQEISFFEGPASETGSLTAAATTHPSNVGNFVGLILAQFISSGSNLLAALILSFVLSWRLAVMVVPSLAVTMTLGLATFECQKRFESDIVADNECRADFVGEAANSIPLLAALTREEETLRRFKVLSSSRRITRRWLVFSSFSLAGSQGMVLLFGALMFYWGAKEVAEGKVELANLFTVIEGATIAVYISVKVLTYTGDYTRMVVSLETIQGWIDRKPAISSEAADDLVDSPVMEKSKGIEFKDVQLRYPSRPDVLALNSLSIRLEAGASYAFCGTSGAGKSSILAVLQRFYDTTSGRVLLDGVDIRSIGNKQLRGQMGYVSQEAVLFEETVRWNLLSGAQDPDSVTQDDLEWACEQACILSFIRSLPHGFDTDLGMKGGQLSGGQRQRLCIARALVRKPRILLLDEATSALDGESERHVQQALDNASRGRTTITVAHRLSTIRNADVIHVMEKGAIVETGSHRDLLALKGRYFELVEAQL